MCQHPTHPPFSSTQTFADWHWSQSASCRCTLRSYLSNWNLCYCWAPIVTGLHSFIWCAHSLAPLTPPRSIHSFWHFLQAMAFSDGFWVSSTLTFRFAKFQPQTVVHVSRGIPHAACPTTCLTNLPLALDIAKTWHLLSSSTSGFGGSLDQVELCHELVVMLLSLA